ncbi:MAG: MobA/MobL family protein [Clostridia bacterium]|nr:MobA/MobL family protein [Clostridia bacterium]
MAIFHWTMQLVKRSKGKSAVAAAAYRSGTKLVNEWDGVTHDYRAKGNVEHTEIILPAHASPAFQNRSVLWNSVEQIEKSKDSQLARDLEISLPIGLSREEQLNLARAYIRDTFVSAGMCADFSFHDKEGNPHIHILLTVRPLKENGEWGAKCRKVYDLDEHGQRIPDGKGGWKNHREDTVDWNSREKVEVWRAAWAEYANRALEAAGRSERIDHRSYERQGIQQIPTVHMGVAATQMERRGIHTEKGDVNRQIAADNKLLKEIKARITRLYNWSKELDEQIGNEFDGMQVLQAHMEQNSDAASRYAKTKRLKEYTALFNLLEANRFTSVQQLHDKIAAVNSSYYDLRGQIVSAERRLNVLNKHLEMWSCYEQYKPIRLQCDKLTGKKQERFMQEHRAELALFDSAYQYLSELKEKGEALAPKKWRSEASALSTQKERLYHKMQGMCEEIKTLETLRRTVDRMIHEMQFHEKDTHEIEQERR